MILQVSYQLQIFIPHPVGVRIPQVYEIFTGIKVQTKYPNICIPASYLIKKILGKKHAKIIKNTQNTQKKYNTYIL